MRFDRRKHTQVDFHESMITLTLGAGVQLVRLSL
ncbi:hypothetical protein ACVMII_001737 [Bradyrhizobium diazoefficiens]